MTLTKQLVALICGLVLLLFAGSFVISVSETRSYLASQLDSVAQDAATSLAFKLSGPEVSKDPVMAELMAGAMFDSGAYRLIAVYHGDQQVVARQASEHLEGVPAWFTDWLPLTSPEKEAEISTGWQPVGKVKVSSNPDLAYRQLWQSARDALIWFAGTALVVILLGVLVLRWMLRPLKAVEAQADAICNRDFPVVPSRPFTLEFRRVVEAMNRLSRKVRGMLDEAEQQADRLRDQAFTDAVTGLANRRCFMDTLAHRVEDPERQGGGALLLVQLNDFKAYNQQAGYAAGDRLLLRCAERLTEAMPDHGRHLVAHTAGADFAVLVDLPGRAVAEQLAGRISQSVAGLYRELSLPSADVGHVGVALFAGQTTSEWLAEADMALRQAQRAGANAVHVASSGADRRAVRGAAEWGDLLRRVLAEDAWELVRQPVFATEDRRVLHEELFLRIPDPDHPGEQLPAGQFLPMAESLGLAADLDRAVLERVLGQVAAGERPVPQAINLSPASLAAPGFVDWLTGRVAAEGHLGGSLIVEFPEYGATMATGLADLVATLERHGVEVALDHFGSGFSSLAQVRSLKAHYLKLDGALVRGLADDSDARFFVQALSRIAHGLDMVVVADSVESEAVWDSLRDLGVDGGRGYWLARPD